jgi:hypothetical protein
MEIIDVRLVIGPREIRWEKIIKTKDGEFRFRDIADDNLTPQEELPFVIASSWLAPERKRHAIMNFIKEARK